LASVPVPTRLTSAFFYPSLVMKRLMTFFFGMIAGAVLLLGAQRYHVIRADDGLHLVPKLHANLADTYVDIRSFTGADWISHPDLASAMIDDDRRELVEGAATDALQNGLDRFLGSDSNP
jgi:hypothetical protein